MPGCPVMASLAEMECELIVERDTDGLEIARRDETHPSSLHELASSTGRTPCNLARTLKTMERYGLERLHKGERGKLRPEVPYRLRDLQLEMTLS